MIQELREGKKKERKPGGSASEEGKLAEQNLRFGCDVHILSWTEMCCVQRSACTHTTNNMSTRLSIKGILLEICIFLKAMHVCVYPARTCKNNTPMSKSISRVITTHFFLLFERHFTALSLLLLTSLISLPAVKYCHLSRAPSK